MKTRKGFTLLELMIVVVILGVLALIAVPSLLNAVDQSREAAVKGNVSAAASTVSSRIAIGAPIALTDDGADDDILQPLNNSADNPYGDVDGDGSPDSTAFSSGDCATIGEVGITDNGDGSYNITGCREDSDGNAEIFVTKTILSNQNSEFNL